MGWSCTAKAGLTLDGISKTFQGSSNTWNTEKGTFFFETGRENADGAITGQVWKMVDVPKKGRCNRSGSFRIETDGTIARFPHLPAWIKKSAVEYGAAEYSRLYVLDRNLQPELGEKYEAETKKELRTHATIMAQQTVASHYNLGSRSSIMSSGVEKTLMSGYAILHGCELSKGGRIELMQALVTLERGVL